MASSIVTPSRRQLIAAGGGRRRAVGLAAPPRVSARRPPRGGRRSPACVRRGAPQAVDARPRAPLGRRHVASLVAMTDPKTGLPADNIPESLAAGDRSGYTSPTNIGGYLWSTVVARELGIISRGECTSAPRPTLKTLLRMEHHEPSGMYYNWYDEATGEVAARPGPTTAARVVPVPAPASTTAGSAPPCSSCGPPTGAPRRWPPRLFDRMRWDIFYDARHRPTPRCARAA